jgi:single-strand DNA-binding protein
MKSVNKVTLLGNVGRDPEVKVLTGGNAVAEFSLATSTGGYTTKDGREVPKKTQWHRIKAFGAITSAIERYVKKGSTIYMEGRIEYSEYEKNGEKRTMTEIILEDMSLLTNPQTGGFITRESIQMQAQRIENPQPTQFSDDLPF